MDKMHPQTLTLLELFLVNHSRGILRYMFSFMFENNSKMRPRLKNVLGWNYSSTFKWTCCKQVMFPLFLETLIATHQGLEGDELGTNLQTHKIIMLWNAHCHDEKKDVGTWWILIMMRCMQHEEHCRSENSILHIWLGLRGWPWPWCWT